MDPATLAAVVSGCDDVVTWLDQVADDDPALPNLHPEFSRRLSALIDAVGDLYVVSGWRSSQRQAELYDGWAAGLPGYNPANPPGSSNHEAVPYGAAMAVAADLGGDLDMAHALAGRHGLHFPMSYEPWHIQPVEVTGSSWPGEMPAMERWTA